MWQGPIHIISDCRYCNYIHEVTLGSANADNDSIGIVLGAFRDDLGLYGAVGHTHTLSFFFNLTSGTNAV